MEGRVIDIFEGTNYPNPFLLFAIMNVQYGVYGHAFQMFREENGEFIDNSMMTIFWILTSTDEVLCIRPFGEMKTTSQFERVRIFFICFHSPSLSSHLFGARIRQI